MLPIKIDLHIHTNVSDGTDKPEELLSKVRDAGFDVFSVTDHDAVKAGAVIRAGLKDGDPRFIQGAEFSCQDGDGRYHILGYGFDPDGEAIKNVIELGHSYRMKKTAERIDFITREFGFEFDKSEIDAILALDNPGKPHIAKLMQKHGYAGSIREAISKYINGIRFTEEYVRPEQAIEGILKSGGIPVLAHPFYGGGDDLILADDMEKRLIRLIGAGLRGIEAFYSGFSVKLQSEALVLAKKHDLLVTAGSDYHGENKNIKLGDTNLAEYGRMPEGMKRFFEILDIGL